MFKNLVNKYSNNSRKFIRPSDSAPKSEDDKEWFIKSAEFIFSCWANNDTSWGYNDLEYIDLNRAYADGRQSKDKYIPKTESKKQPDKNSRKGDQYKNYDIVPVIPKFREAFVGLMLKSVYDPVAKAIDPFSSKERDDKIKMTKFMMSRKGFIESYRKSANLPAPDQEYIPEDNIEFEMYKMMGGSKLSQENAAEIGLTSITNDSDLDTEVNPRLIYDIFSINRCCTQDLFNNDKRSVISYLDPKYVIVPKSSYTDHRDKDYAGVIKFVSGSGLREMVNKEISDKELEQIISDNSSYYNSGNNSDDFSHDSTSNRPIDDRSGFKLDKYQYPYLDFEIRGEKISYIKRKNGAEIKYDNVRKNELKSGKIYKKCEEIWYRGKWIIGTKHVFDFGPQYDVPLDQNDNPRSSIHVIKFPGVSKCESMINFADSIQFAQLKILSNTANAPGRGLAIEWNSLQNIDLGEGKQLPLDIIRIYKEKNVLVYKATTHRGVVNLPTGNKPIIPIEGGIGQALDDFIKVVDHSLRMMREITGLNKGVDSSDPQRDVTNKNAEHAVISAQNNISTLLSGFLTLRKESYINALSRLMLYVSNYSDVYECYRDTFNDATISVFKISADNLNGKGYRYIIELKERPNDQIKAEIRQASAAALNGGKDGVPTINYDDYLLILQLIDSNRIHYARSLMSYKIRKNRELFDKNSKEKIKMQGDDAVRLQKSKELHEINLKNIDSRTDIIKTALSGDNKLKEKYIEGVMKKDLALLTQGKEDTINESEIYLNLVNESEQKTAKFLSSSQQQEQQ